MKNLEILMLANFNAGYDKIKFLTDDSLALEKLIYFPTLTVVIRCVFKQFI